jgi:hypothetical protein
MHSSVEKEWLHGVQKKTQPIVTLSTTEAEYVPLLMRQRKYFGSGIFWANLPKHSGTQLPFIATAYQLSI